MEWLFGGISLLFGIIGYLLSLKDKRQGEEIMEIKEKCKVDFANLYKISHNIEEKLAEHKLHVAQNHYTQPQVDFRFQQLDTTMKEGFRELSRDIKDMTNKLVAHLAGTEDK